MRYRVTFMERTDADTNPSEVVLDRTFVERTEPAAIHVEDRNSQMAMECVPLGDSEDSGA